MAEKINVAVICGGKSAEHEVSLASTRNVLSGLDRDKYNIHLLVIDRQGQLLASGSPDELLAPASAEEAPGQGVLTAPTEIGDEPVAITVQDSNATLVSLETGQGEPMARIDVVFPMMHGPGGEDGSIQGLGQLANVAVVGCDVLGSAVNLDKDVMKRLLRDSGLPVSRFVSLRRHHRGSLSYQDVVDQVGLPFYVKPCNLGSSVGITRVGSEEEFEAAVDQAFAYDTKIVFEENVPGRELECAVLGTDELIVSLPGEVITGQGHDFYTYDAKYLDESGAVIQVPADLPPEVAAKMQELAGQAYEATCCAGMARVDFFLRDDGEIFVNELNTIPGFTDASMYPGLMAASGIPLNELVDRLIEDALKRFEERQLLSNNV